MCLGSCQRKSSIPALQFIKSARTAGNLALRIAPYCSAPETIFLTDSAELSHKLAERTAFLLAEFGYPKGEVFRTIKTAYGIRSKLTHGDTIPARTIEELPTLSSTCDGYLRMIFRSLFGKEWLVSRLDVPPEQIEKLFHDLIFEGKRFRGEPGDGKLVYMITIPAVFLWEREQCPLPLLDRT